MAEEKIIQLIEIQTDTSSLKTLKQEIKDAKDEMERLSNGLAKAEQNAEDIGKKFGTGSAEFKKATAEVQKFQQSLVNSAKGVAVLKDRMDDVNDQVNSFHPDKKFQGLALSAQIGATALQGVAGVMTTLGVESETAAETMARLQGLMAFTQALKDVKGLSGEWEAFKRTIGGAKTATEAQTKATQGATVASKGLGMAMKAMGIGLIISAVAYLVSNWDKLRESVVKLIPTLGNAGSMFDKVKAIAFGMGNVLLKFVAGPIQAIIQAITGDFSGALDTVQGMFKFKANAMEGYNNEIEAQKDKQHKEGLEKQIKRNQDNIDVAKAAGRDTYKMEMENFQKRKELAKGNTEELAKISQDELLFTTAHNKKMSDQRNASNQKAAQDGAQRTAQLKAQLEKEKELYENYQKEINDIIEGTSKEIARSKMNDRDKELFDVNENFNKALAATQKNYDESLKILKNKKLSQAEYNKEVLKLDEDNTKARTLLTEQKGIKDLEISKKYNQQISAYLDQYNKSEYDRRRKQVEDEFKAMLLVVTDPIKRKELEDAMNKALNNMEDAETARTITVEQETKYTNTVSTNMEDENDPAMLAVMKETNVYEALKALRAAQFQERLIALGDDQAAIDLEKAKFNQEELSAEQAHSDKLKAIWEAEAESKRELENLKYQAVSTALGLLEQLAGRNKKLADAAFLLEKGVTISKIVMDTIKRISAIKTAAELQSVSLSAIPVVGAGLAAAVKANAAREVLSAKLQAGIAIASIAGSTLGRFMNSAGGSTDSGGTEAPMIAQAPQINASNLNVQQVDVRSTNQQESVVKAYITDKDLKSNEEKTNFLNKLGSF